MSLQFSSVEKIRKAVDSLCNAGKMLLLCALYNKHVTCELKVMRLLYVHHVHISSSIISSHVFSSSTHHQILLGK